MAAATLRAENVHEARALTPRVNMNLERGCDMTTDSKQPSATGKIAMILGIAIGLWLAWWYYAALAADGAPQGARIRSEVSASGPMSLESTQAGAPRRDAMRTHLEAMNERDLKRFYVRCSQEGSERRLDGGEAMACSVGYDVLLQKHFAGDFKRLLAWSRSPRAAETR